MAEPVVRTEPEWLELSTSAADDDAVLAEWLDISLAYNLAVGE